MPTKIWKIHQQHNNKIFFGTKFLAQILNNNYRSPANIWARLRTRPVSEAQLRTTVAHPRLPLLELEALAVDAKGHQFTKWWHYFEIYDDNLRELATKSREGMVTQPIRILEIGVWKGGSMNLWRQYFGDEAIIFGIDIDPSCLDIDFVNAEIRIGSQIDAEFVNSVIKEMGGVDIVIDDGSHQCADVLRTLNLIFPHLSENGFYFIEDLHTSYWPGFGGGYRRRDSSIEILKKSIDHLYQPYIGVKAETNPIPLTLSGFKSITFFDSITLLRKGKIRSPEFFMGGSADVVDPCEQEA